jgi:hypothetical protein
LHLYSCIRVACFQIFLAESMQKLKARDSKAWRPLEDEVAHLRQELGAAPHQHDATQRCPSHRSHLPPSKMQRPRRSRMCRRKLFRRRMSSWGVRPDPRRRAPNPSDTKESMSRIKSKVLKSGTGYRGYDDDDVSIAQVRLVPEPYYNRR